jgi:hypothetical protein
MHFYFYFTFRELDSSKRFLFARTPLKSILSQKKIHFFTISVHFALEEKNHIFVV